MVILVLLLLNLNFSASLEAVRASSLSSVPMSVYIVLPEVVLVARQLLDALGLSRCIILLLAPGNGMLGCISLRPAKLLAVLVAVSSLDQSDVSLSLRRGSDTLHESVSVDGILLGSISRHSLRADGGAFIVVVELMSNIVFGFRLVKSGDLGLERDLALSAIGGRVHHAGAVDGDVVDNFDVGHF